MIEYPYTPPQIDKAMSDLATWLDRIYTIRSGPEIEMGLERIRPVFDAMNVKPTCPVFLVGGTNGKGSVCAYIDTILRSAGYKTKNCVDVRTD